MCIYLCFGYVGHIYTKHTNILLIQYIVKYGIVTHKNIQTHASTHVYTDI